MEKSTEKSNFNTCLDWGLFCFNFNEGVNGVTLNCCLNGQARQDGTFPRGIPVTVFCDYEKCDIFKDDYTKCYIDVNGHIIVAEATNNQTGEKYSYLMIFADKVRMKQWDR